MIRELTPFVFSCPETFAKNGQLVELGALIELAGSFTTIFAIKDEALDISSFFPYLTSHENITMGQQWSAYSPGDEDPWFRPNLRTREYEDFGDVYSDDTYTRVSEDWVLGPTPGCGYILEKVISTNMIGVGKIDHTWHSSNRSKIVGFISGFLQTSCRLALIPSDGKISTNQLKGGAKIEQLGLRKSKSADWTITKQGAQKV
jgi:hypothetical protein